MSTETIWNEFSDRLENFIYARVNDRETAKDLLQEVFIKIHLKKDSIKDEDKLPSWLFQITRNAIIDFYRKKKIQTDELLEHLENPSNDEVLMAENQIQNCLQPYIDALPEKYKDALKKTAFEKVSQKELAQLEDISYSAAKSRVQRAREMVKQQIIDCCDPKTDVYGNVLEKDPCKNECGCEE